MVERSGYNNNPGFNNPDFAAPVMWWRLLSGQPDRAMNGGMLPQLENMQRQMRQMMNGTLNMSHMIMPWWFNNMTGDLSVDILESDDAYRIKADIPDREMRNIEISVARDAILITGESAEESSEENERYIRRERAGLSFSRTIVLPGDADYDRARAFYEGNLLTIEVPRRREGEGAARKLRAVPQGAEAAGRAARNRKPAARKGRKKA